MRNNIQKIQKFKEDGKKITVLTAYDNSTAKYVDEAGCDMILVGDSLAQVVLGYDNTTDIGIEEMVIFTRAVSKAVKSALLIADMPFGSCLDKKTTVENACKLIKAGANAVKIEGASDFLVDCIKHLTQNGIPVAGHLGFTPQSINALGGHKVQGKDAKRSIQMLEDAKKLQEAGCFCVVLEMVPKETSKYITKNLLIPTIGIGAGLDCDGQVLVSDDIFGKYDRFTPKFAKKYADLASIMKKAVTDYCKDVEQGVFPALEHSFSLDEDERLKLENC